MSICSGVVARGSSSIERRAVGETLKYRSIAPDSVVIASGRKKFGDPPPSEISVIGGFPSRAWATRTISVASVSTYASPRSTDRVTVTLHPQYQHSDRQNGTWTYSDSGVASCPSRLNSSRARRC